MGNTAQQCRRGFFSRFWFCRRSRRFKINIIFGSHTFVPISWMCKKQTSVSHSSTEAEIISLDAGLRIDGMPALDLWDLVTEVFHSSPNRLKKSKGEEYRETRRVKPHQTSTPKTKPRFQPQHDNFDLNNKCLPSWLKPFPSKTMWRFGVHPAVVVDPLGKTTAGARGNCSCEWTRIGRYRPEHDVKRLPSATRFSSWYYRLCGDEVCVQLFLQSYVAASWTRRKTVHAPVCVSMQREIRTSPWNQRFRG